MSAKQPRSLKSSALAEQLCAAYEQERQSLEAIHDARLRWPGVAAFWSRLNKEFVETKQQLRILENALKLHGGMAGIIAAAPAEEGETLSGMTARHMSLYSALRITALQHFDEAILDLCDMRLAQKTLFAEWIAESLPEAGYMPATAATGNAASLH